MHSTILQIGPITIGAYALMVTIAFLVGAFLAVRRAKEYGILPHEVTNLVTLILITSIVGSRMLYVFEHIRAFSENPISIFLISQGGLSYNGGLFFALIGAFCWLKRKKIPVVRMLDILAPTIPLGFFLVRIGCFLNGCCFGNPTDMPWGVVFPSDSPAGWVYKNIKIHPTQLYSSFSGLISFFILLGFEKKLQFAKGNGLLFFSFLILSALWRFIIEFFRYQEPQSIMVGWFTEAQAYCVGIFIVSMTMILRIYMKKFKR